MSDLKARLITMKSACVRGGFGKTRAYELINDGTLKAYKMGHTTMIDPDTIDAYHASLPRYEPKLIEPKPKKPKPNRNAAA